MSRRGAPEYRDSLPNQPSIVRVTVESGPRGRVAGARAVRLRAALVVAGLVVAGAAIGGAVLAAGRGGTPRRASAQMRSVGGARTAEQAVGAQAGPRLRGMSQVTSITEAFRFPLGCMSGTLTREALATALASRTGPCWHYGLFVTAVVRRVDGVWQLALAARSPSCPDIGVPPVVRARLAECQR
jgi:hypothetical protein